MSQPRGKKPAPPAALLTKPGVIQGKAEPPGGTPIGWTFYSSYKRCDRLWFLRYVLQMFPREVPEHFAVGTCYHALLEGKTEAEIQSWGPEFVKALPVAKKLYAERMKPSAPKMGKLVSAEETLTATGHLKEKYTSKPDRIEISDDAPSMYGDKKVKSEETPRIVREFKTAATFRDNDDDRWKVNGEVIGELVTSGLKEAVVDIIGKFDQPTVRQIQVVLTEQKQQRWEALVDDVIAQVRRRLNTLRVELLEARAAPSFLEDAPVVDRHFPPNLENCVSFSGHQCDYYNLCWGEKTPMNRHFFIKKNGKLDWARRLDVKPLVEEILKFDLRKRV